MPIKIPEKGQLSWDQYFYLMCKQVSLRSPCLSRRIGAILVRDNSIISTGYNGPARGVPHCGQERFKVDESIAHLGQEFTPEEINTTCPRRLMRIKSGESMHLCPAQHAEENCISNAARNGVNTLDSTLYISAPIPCKNCFSTLINAGISEIVCEILDYYDPYTLFIHQSSNIIIRKFEL